MLNFLLALWFSCSIQTAKIQPNPLNYEYVWGLEATKLKIEQCFERENNKRFFSQDLYIGRIGDDFSGGELRWILNGARNLDTQEMIYSRGKALRWSATLSCLHWQEPTAMLGAEYKNECLSVGVKTDFHSRSRFWYRAKKKFMLNDMLWFMPESRLDSITGSLPSYASKLSFGIDLRK